MNKMAETTEELKWNAMMDALEASWLVKMADTSADCQRERLSTNNTMPESLKREHPLV